MLALDARSGVRCAPPHPRAACMVAQVDMELARHPTTNDYNRQVKGGTPRTKEELRK